jgi:hypothetical protein
MEQMRKASFAREWIIFALSIGIGGHIALGLVLHDPAHQWYEMGWNTLFIGVFVYIAVQAGRSIFFAVRAHRAKLDP